MRRVGEAVPLAMTPDVDVAEQQEAESWLSLGARTERAEPTRHNGVVRVQQRYWHPLRSGATADALSRS